MAGAAVDRETLSLIRRVVLEEAEKLGVAVERIILFGSRVRGDYREDSDYDILVVVRGEVERGLRRELSRRVRWRVVELLRAPVDVVVAPEGRWGSLQDSVGHLYYVVKREGVTV